MITASIIDQQQNQWCGIIVGLRSTFAAYFASIPMQVVVLAKIDSGQAQL